MSDSNTTNLTIIIVLFLVLIGVGGYFTINHLFDKHEEESDQQEEMAEKKDTSIDRQEEKYQSYQIGDYVTLKDGSDWNVIEKSDEDAERVTLLKREQLPNSIDFQEATSYIENTYPNEFVTSLGINSSEINARLLSLEDIKRVTGIANLEPGVTIEDSNQMFLYSSSTLTDEEKEDTPILICEKTSDDLAKICMGTGTTTWKVRPVIEISKKYIK